MKNTSNSICCGCFAIWATARPDHGSFTPSGVFFTPDSCGLDGEVKNAPPSKKILHCVQNDK